MIWVKQTKRNINQGYNLMKELYRATQQGKGPQSTGLKILWEKLNQDKGPMC